MDLKPRKVKFRCPTNHNLTRSRERQYKRRIEQWRLDKNVKTEEMRAILRIQKSRKNKGKDSVFYVRGRRVDHNKIERFALRKTAGFADQSENMPGRKLISNVTRLCL